MEIRFSDYKSYDGRVSESEFNALVDLMQRVALCPGVGYTLSRNVTGTVIQTKPGSGGSSAIPCPFDVTVKAGAGNNDKIANVRVGSVNQLVPDNYKQDFHFDPTGDDIQVKVKVNTDGAKVTSCTLVVDSSDPNQQTPTPFALPSEVEILVAVIIDGTPYRIIPCGSIQLVGQEQYKTDKETPAEPGQLQYTAYYSWVLQ